ncbi:MAG: DUF1456 family protein [Aquirhabdus sp.]
MMNNDVLRSVRYMLNLSDSRMVDVFALVDYSVAEADVADFLRAEDDEAFLAIPDEAMLYFLNGLIIHLRGKKDDQPHAPVTLPNSNNLMLKKLRVAFNLKEEDMQDILQSVDFNISKPELSALFRAEGHSNYRACGDQFLRNFLKGLTLRVRK